MSNTRRNARSNLGIRDSWGLSKMLKGRCWQVGCKLSNTGDACEDQITDFGKQIIDIRSLLLGKEGPVIV